jgi:hypothetical protein
VSRTLSASVLIGVERRWYQAFGAVNFQRLRNVGKTAEAEIESENQDFTIWNLYFHLIIFYPQDQESVETPRFKRQLSMRSPIYTLRPIDLKASQSWRTTPVTQSLHPELSYVHACTMNLSSDSVQAGKALPPVSIHFVRST